MNSGAAGYSGTPLVKKLGIKEGFKIYLIRPLNHYRELVEPLPANVRFLKRRSREMHMVHIFTTFRRELEKELPLMMERIRRDGMIWVSWPKKSSRVFSQVTEDVVRAVALPLGLVDVKVCAVDAVWSGLKLVIRKENR